MEYPRKTRGNRSRTLGKTANDRLTDNKDARKTPSE